MQLIEQASLKKYNTFAIEEKCDYLATVNSVEQLKQLLEDSRFKSAPKLMLGSGSNVLFTQHFKGLIIRNNIKGISVSENDQYYNLEVNGGEDWPELVEWCVRQGYAGLENLALIPGCAGSAPIQNIGAYGIELKDVCEYVDYLDSTTLEINRLNTSECLFGYRDSVFKHALKGHTYITKIGLRVSKYWAPKLSYGGLKDLLGETPTPLDLFNAVCDIRKSKLPDPKVLGNAGSFFKNPVISQAQLVEIQKEYPNIPAYPAKGGTKLAAGWLIDQSNLKGHKVGGAMVHNKQALVLVNFNEASAQDVIHLAKHVQSTVFQKFNVKLEHEVRFIGAQNEVYLEELI